MWIYGNAGKDDKKLNEAGMVARELEETRLFFVFFGLLYSNWGENGQIHTDANLAAEMKHSY